jgi:hypothetical protein
MLRALSVAWIAGVAAALALPAVAAAEPTPGQLSRADAARHFELGLRTFERGDFDRAADEFEQAYRILPHADALWNAARARDRAGQAPRAATLYAKYLREARDETAERRDASARLLAFSSRLGQVNVQGDLVRRIVVDDQPLDERIFYVIPGAHVLRVSLAGGESQQRTVEVGAGEAVSLVFEPAPAAPAASPAANPSPTRAASPAPAPPSPMGPRPWAPRPSMLVVAAGATAVSVGLTIASGVDTLSALHTYEARPTTENLWAGQARQARTNVGIGVSAGLAALTVAGTIWWAAARPARSGVVAIGITRLAPLRSAPHLAPPPGLAVRWRL